jgi:hypothetical protein
MIADNFGVPIWAQTSHATRENEGMGGSLNHLPRMIWGDWMVVLSTFKYAVHMMPTVAAGTFALNCAYFGIPCIGNQDVDTQLLCHPSLSVAVNDLEAARELAIRLRDDKEFYKQCSEIAKNNYEACFSKELWLRNIKREL